MHPVQPLIIQPRVIVVDVSAQCADAALLDAAGGAIYGAYHYDAAAPFADANGALCYQVYPLAITPLRPTPGFSAERALGARNPKSGLPLALAYLDEIAERFGAPQVFPDVVVADPASYREVYAGLLNECQRGGAFNRLPLWASQASRHKTLRVRQRASSAGKSAPESLLIDYIAADGSRGCFGIDMRNHVDKSLPRPACASGWSTPAEILRAVEKQFSRCADIRREDYQTYEVPVHGKLLRESFFWADDIAPDEVLRVRARAGNAYTVSYPNAQGQACEIELKVALHGAARLAGAIEWLDIVVAIEQECAAYPGFDPERYRVVEISDGLRVQREMFLPQIPVEVRQAA